jgi:hypothetical protein
MSLMMQAMQRTPLHWAALGCSTTIVRKLLAVTGTSLLDKQDVRALARRAACCVLVPTPLFSIALLPVDRRRQATRH